MWARFREAFAAKAATETEAEGTSEEERGNDGSKAGEEGERDEDFRDEL